MIMTIGRDEEEKSTNNRSDKILCVPWSTGQALCAVLGSASPLGITLQNNIPHPDKKDESKMKNKHKIVVAISGASGSVRACCTGPRAK